MQFSQHEFDGDHFQAQVNPGYELPLNSLVEDIPATATNDIICKPKSRSVVSQSPPSYSNVTVQPPPSYKDLFPKIFRTFSLITNASFDLPPAEEVREQKCKLLKIVLCVCFAMGVLWLIIEYLIK